MNLMAGSTDGLARQVVSDAPAVISILLNDKCNLRCSHCYLENIVESDRLSSEEWGKTFRSLFGDLAPGAVSFAGKEIFVEQESVDVFFNALKTRDELQKDNRRTDIGVITNGTLVDKFQNRLEASTLDWIDISIDGSREHHDAIRGKGAYAKAGGNLAWLQRRFGKHLWILSTLCDTNSKGMTSMIRELSEKYGISGFSFGVYKDRYSASNQHSTSYDSIADFFDDLRRMPKLDKPATVVFDFTKDLHEYSAMFGMPEPKGETITEHEEDLGNKVILKVHRANVPVGLWRAVRISSGGEWIAAEDLLDHQKYKKSAVATLRDVGYDTRKAYELGLQSRRAKELGVFAEIA